MDSKQTLVFRCDNAKHFPKLNNFPHHKHVLNEVITFNEPEIDKILTEIETIVLK